MIHRTILKLCACILLIAGLSKAQAQMDYPNRVIHLIVPFSAGGAADAVARPLAVELAKKLGQPIVVENKPGANSTLGTRYVARAPADGYTLLFGADAGLSLAPNTQGHLGYDVARDFAPVAVIGFGDQVLVVNGRSPIRSVQDLARLAQAQRGALPYASYGVGSLSHASMEALAKRMNASMNHVPYQGVAPALNDLLGGQVEVMMASVAAPLPHIKAGKLRAIGFAGPTRSPLLPNVPTIAEQGYPGFQARGWFCVVTPAATPPAVLAKLRFAVAEIIQSPSFKMNVLVANGYESSHMRPEDLSSFLASEIVKSKALIDPIRSQLK
ncbi:MULTISPECIES: Bug family tripartite tricarboxylate transporter substrate binding protein [Cupriavidus]|uniref:Tripartite-type tricarboxylate transporter receptor subunit TctC n=1 Tax=Cupriavidus alkaliphilus TaxID=942866 RepID=A0A7W4YU75_9BURK|nr:MULTISPECIES: tripartite tricarboxylate transporter substrate binding protein [Cupriavidus]MBB3009931.1 tripartite-type tricarboxylate transporter receptor subunit TctC [Cupriavidus alkaliphilus]GLC97769.1 hypothetical protein Tamer19_71780 [Cupriavidus sp. TA19]